MKGRYQIFRSLTTLNQELPFLSRQTLNRVITSLRNKRLLRVSSGTGLNKRKADRTRWFSIDERGFDSLESIRLFTVKTQKNKLSQNETTLHYKNKNNTTETLLRNISVGQAEACTDAAPHAYAGESFDFNFDDLSTREVNVESFDTQPLLSPIFSVPKKKESLKGPLDGSLESIPKMAHALMYQLCYRAETMQEQLSLTSTQRGRVASTLGKLQKSKADISKLHLFESWWVQNWRSKDRGTGQYQAPRPEQVLELWNEAMKSGTRPALNTNVVEQLTPKREPVDLDAVMKKHVHSRE